jgi:hypothetical protein
VNDKHDFPWEAIAAIGQTLEANAPKHGMKSTWRSIDIEAHLVHAHNHIASWFSGDQSEPHIEHALTRLAFAAALLEESQK